MKKKIFMITLAACLVVLSIAGTSLAYFTDTDAKTNVFTAGNVDITLDYNEDTTRLYPGQAYDKIATIENVGSENAYVGIIIEVITDDFDLNTIKSVFTVPGNDTVKYVEVEAGKYAIFAVVEDVLTTAETPATATVTIATKMTIPAGWNTEMAAFNNLSVKVTAYATQTVGFDNGAAQALTAAFTAWADYN